MPIMEKFAKYASDDETSNIEIDGQTLYNEDGNESTYKDMYLEDQEFVDQEDVLRRMSKVHPEESNNPVSESIHNLSAEMQGSNKQTSYRKGTIGQSSVENGSIEPGSLG